MSKNWSGKEIYDKYFSDSTEHAVYSIKISSENDEEYYTVELHDHTIREIMDLIAEDLHE